MYFITLLVKLQKNVLHYITKIVTNYVLPIQVTIVTHSMQKSTYCCPKQDRTLLVTQMGFQLGLLSLSPS